MQAGYKRLTPVLQALISVLYPFYTRCISVVYPLYTRYRSPVLPCLRGGVSGSPMAAPPSTSRVLTALVSPSFKGNRILPPSHWPVSGVPVGDQEPRDKYGGEVGKERGSQPSLPILGLRRRWHKPGPCSISHRGRFFLGEGQRHGIIESKASHEATESR
jgi:hypothetical protein